MFNYLLKIIVILLLIALESHSQDLGIGLESPVRVRTVIDSLETVLAEIEDDTLSVNLLNQISKYYRAIDEFQSFSKAQEALEKAEKIHFWKGVSASYASLGFINNEQGLINQAIEMYQQGIRVAEKHHYYKDLLYCLNGIGIIYWEKRNYQKALETFKRNLHIQDSLHMELESGTSYNNIGLLYIYLKKYDDALAYLEKSREIHIKYKISEKSIATLNNLGILYLGRKDYQKALSYSLESLKMAKKYYQKRRIKESTLTLSDIYKEMAKHEEAYKYLKEYQVLSDTIEKQNKASVIAEIKRKKDLELKEKQIDILKQNSQLRNILYVGSTLCLLAIIIVTLVRTGRKRKFYQILETKNTEINTQKIFIEQQNAELLALNDNLEKLVEDRTQKLYESNIRLTSINTELDTYVYRFAHDFRSPLATMMGLSNLGQNSTEQSDYKEILDKIYLTSQQMDGFLRKISFLHEISHHINHFERIDFDTLCENTLKHISHRHRAYQGVTYNYEGIREIEADYTLLCICIENILENAFIFSRAESPPNIRIQVAKQGNMSVSIKIKDEGMGIEQRLMSRIFQIFFRGHEFSKGNGLGLHIVLKAMEKMQGAVLIESEVGSFTEIELLIPCVHLLENHPT